MIIHFLCKAEWPGLVFVAITADDGHEWREQRSWTESAHSIDAANAVDVNELAIVDGSRIDEYTTNIVSRWWYGVDLGR